VIVVEPPAHNVDAVAVVVTFGSGLIVNVNVAVFTQPAVFNEV